jgi:hypothetical protein
VRSKKPIQILSLIIPHIFGVEWVPVDGIDLNEDGVLSID